MIRKNLVWGTGLVCALVLGISGYAMANTHATNQATTSCTTPGQVLQAGVFHALIGDQDIVGSSIYIGEDSIPPDAQTTATLIGQRHNLWVTSTQTGHGLDTSIVINLNRAPSTPVRVLVQMICAPPL